MTQKELEKRFETNYYLKGLPEENKKEFIKYFSDGSTMEPFEINLKKYKYNIEYGLNRGKKRWIDLMMYKNNYTYFGHYQWHILNNPELIEYVYKNYEDKFIQSLTKNFLAFRALKAFYTFNPSKYKEGTIERAKKLLEHEYQKDCFDFLEEVLPHQEYKDYAVKQISTLFKKGKAPLELFDTLQPLISHEDFYAAVKSYIINTRWIGNVQKILEKYFSKEENFDLVILAFEKGHSNKQFYQFLQTVDYQKHFDFIFDFVSEHDRFEDYAIKALNRHTDLSYAKTEALLLSKNQDDRKLAYSLLFDQNSEKSIEVAKTHLKKEVDKVREKFLENLAQHYPKNPTKKDLATLIADAKERKALQWNEDFDITELPPLYFNDHTPLNEEEILFLFYRMRLVQEAKSDIEANFLLHHIDKTTSNTFATFTLDKFITQGLVAKQKYLITLSGLLGDESLYDRLKQLFNELFETKRMKMVQFPIGALALIGTNKALRFIDFVSRKYKKKAALHEFCLRSLDIAAGELGITRQELGDQIIPNFGFEGLYKTIEVNDEEVKVFVGKDFKLQFITSDNKIRKSVPKEATTEVKNTLKMIQKEIREANKYQLDRLEQFMIQQRRMTFQDWQNYYLLNPIMFIYASQFVWGVYTEDTLEQLFYIDEDSAMLNLDGDEIDLESDQIIGLPHPIEFSSEALTAWANHFYDLEIPQPYEQLNRRVFSVSDVKIEENQITHFNGKTPEKGTSAIKTYLEKRDYHKDVIDGGAVSFYKPFYKNDLTLHLGIYGINASYYGDEVVEINSSYFTTLNSSYWDKKLIPMHEVPPIILSEIILDLKNICGE